MLKKKNLLFEEPVPLLQLLTTVVNVGISQ